MPLNTAMPIERRAFAPAPVASTSGTTPRINANEVIRIGRKRSRAAVTAASARVAGWIPTTLGVLGGLLIGGLILDLVRRRR